MKVEKFHSRNRGVPVLRKQYHKCDGPALNEKFFSFGFLGLLSIVIEKCVIPINARMLLY